MYQWSQISFNLIHILLRTIFLPRTVDTVFTSFRVINYGHLKVNIRMHIEICGSVLKFILE